MAELHKEIKYYLSLTKEEAEYLRDLLSDIGPYEDKKLDAKRCHLFNTIDDTLKRE